MHLAGRLSRVVVLLCTPMFLTACAARDVAPANAGLRPSPCSNNNAVSTRQAPVVCVDDSARTLRVTPDPVETHNVLAADRKSPVMLHWYTTSGGGDLQLEIEPGCVTEQRCDGRGHCSARTLPKATKTQCKYDVWINGGNHDRLDPTIVISPCCT
jgi:YD repeat-containing protein